MLMHFSLHSYDHETVERVEHSIAAFTGFPEGFLDGRGRPG